MAPRPGFRRHAVRPCRERVQASLDGSCRALPNERPDSASRHPWKPPQSVLVLFIVGRVTVEQADGLGAGTPGSLDGAVDAARDGRPVPVRLRAGPKDAQRIVLG